jgi:uncharacterized protein YktA (UPF0223 family)
MLTSADREKGQKATKTNLTLKQKIAVGEYLKTGNKSAAVRAAYNLKPHNVKQVANRFFKQPKIVSALDKALKTAKFDDQYAVDTLKDIIEAGMQNKDIARPDTALKAIETYFKVTNKMGGGNKTAIKIDIESQAKKMDINELMQGMRDLDKKYKRLKQVMTGKAEEGEVVDETD